MIRQEMTYICDVCGVVHYEKKLLTLDSIPLILIVPKGWHRFDEKLICNNHRAEVQRAENWADVSLRAGQCKCRKSP